MLQGIWKTSGRRRAYVVLLQLKEKAGESLRGRWKDGVVEVFQAALVRIGRDCRTEVDEGNGRRWVAKVGSQSSGKILETHFNLGQIDESDKEKGVGKCCERI